MSGAPGTSSAGAGSSGGSGGGGGGSGSLKCDACGSTDIDVDPSRADAVCTGCGNVLESSIIVSDIQFEENAHGGSSAIGTFVSNETKGGGFSGAAMGGGGGGGGGGMRIGGLQVGLGRESRELTLRNARKKIEALAHQLTLRRDRIDKAFHFYKLALASNLTRGRKSTHVIAACVYITCRTENPPTSHMLIDFSDVLQIDVYELGRTYLRLSQALHITIPALDPCLYVMRFAHKLEFGEKTHEVSMTALRLVSRMKKDWMHYGRRPSGLCGAALLIASRLHSFHRSVYDVIKVVKVHESTLRKRLNEFGETPASQLSLDEFINVDLDAMTEEQDPPSFKAARKRDKDRLLQLEMEADIDTEISELESTIGAELDKMREKVMGKKYAKYARDKQQEQREQEAFIAEQTLESINEFVDKDKSLMPPPPKPATSSASSPFPVGLGLKDTLAEYLSPSVEGRKPDFIAPEDTEDGELDLTGIDDDEINGYIMSKDEVDMKTKMWEKVNAEYLREKAEKEERERQEAEEAAKEGREIKKKVTRKTKEKAKKAGGPGGGSATVIEAIEKIVQEKKISTKINYDVLKNLTLPSQVDSKQSLAELKESTQAQATASTSSSSGFESPSRSSIFSPAAGSTSPRKSFSDARDLAASASGSGISRKRLPSFKSPPASPTKKHFKTEKNVTPPSIVKSSKDLVTSREEPVTSPAEKPKESEVIVESGPVVRGDADHGEEDDLDEDLEDDDDLDEDLDEGNDDLAKMLSQHRGDDELDEDAYGEEEYY